MGTVLRSKRAVFRLYLPLALALLLGMGIKAFSAQPDGVRGAASGATVESGKTKVAPAPQVLLPGGGGAVFTEAPAINVPDVVSTGSLRAISNGAFGAADTSAQSLSTIENVTAVRVSLVGVLDRIHVESIVVEEPRIFRGDDGALQVVRDEVIRHPAVLEARPGVARSQPCEAALHVCGGARIMFPQSPDLPVGPAVVGDDHDREQGQETDRPAAEPPRSCRTCRTDRRTHVVVPLLKI